VSKTALISLPPLRKGSGALSDEDELLDATRAATWEGELDWPLPCILRTESGVWSVLSVEDCSNPLTSCCT
jgi:hypothetical protein